MRIQEQIEINGLLFPYERDMTEDEQTEYLKNIYAHNDIDEENETPQTDTERIEKLEEAIQLLLSGGTE